MKVIANNFRVQYDESDQAELVIRTGLSRVKLMEKHSKDLSKLKEIVVSGTGKKLDIEITQHKEKRSIDANAMLWVMCQQIAEALRSTKEEIYQVAVRQVGPFRIIPIEDEAVGKWIEIWNGKGLGWFAEVYGKSKLEGYTNTINYYGSSVYDTKEMSRLIDHIITDAREAGIDVMTENEKNLLLQAWEKKQAS